MSTGRHVERFGRKLAAQIAGQAGLVTNAQLAAAGWSPGAIRWQVTSGRWVTVLPGVHLTTPGRDDDEVRFVAALLAVGTPAALTRSSAGAAWGLVSSPSGPVEVLVPITRSGASPRGVKLVRTEHFDQRVDPRAWPHRTTVEHTVFDLGTGPDPDRVIALMARACQQRLTTESGLANALATRPKQIHRAVITETLGLVGAGAESVAEVRYIRDVEQAHGLPTGERQAPGPGGRRRDTFYRAQRVVVEIDGRLGHVGWAAQRKAGRRDRAALVDGVLTIRTGWDELVDVPCEFTVDLAQILTRQGWDEQAHACLRPGCAVGRLLAA